MARKRKSNSNIVPKITDKQRSQVDARRVKVMRKYGRRGGAEEYSKG